MKKIQKALKLSVFLLLASTVFIACDKDFNTLGSDIIGSKELLEALNYKINL